MKFEYNGQSFELIMLTVTGSRMYGNATEKSDWDYRGIYIESLENKLGIKDSIEQLGGANKQGITYELDKSGNKIYNIQGREIYEILKANGLNLNETDDIELYELNRFTKLALDNNPNILDLLCHNTKNSIYLNEIGKELLDNKDLFLSQKLRHTFSGYALSQLKRIKSHNKWIEEFPDTHKVISYLSLAYAKNKIDFNWITDNFGGQVAEQITQETPQKNRKVPNDLKWSWEDFLQFNQTGVNLNKYRLPRLTDFCYPKDLNGKKLSMTDKKYSIIGEFYYTEDSEEHPKMFSLKEILEKNASFRTFSPSMLSIYTNGNGIFTKEGNLRPNDPEKIGDFICLLSIDQMKYKSTKDHISKMWNWKCNRNEQRAELEEKHGFDSKHASHLVRLMSACKEILLNNQYIPELNGDRLQIVKDVRNGKYSYEWLIDYSEKEDKKLDEYLKVSTLQEKPNYEAIHNLLITLQEKSLDIKIDRDFN